MYDFKYMFIKIILISKSLKLNFLTIFVILFDYLNNIPMIVTYYKISEINHYNKTSKNGFNQNIFS